MHGDGKLHVHIDNTDELLNPVRTESVEAQHYTADGFALTGAGINSGPPVQILQLDPLRKRAVLSVNGAGQVVLCHSMQQATSMQQGQNINADEADLITAPATITVESTGPLWAVGVATASQVAVVSPLTSTVAGKVAAPGAGATIVTTGALSGVYEIVVTIYIDGTDTAATDDDNMDLAISGLGTTNLIVPADTTGPVIATTMFTNTLTAQTLAVKAIAAASAGTVYHAQIAYTQIATVTTGIMTVGVLQERRNS
jgi:hypothetical protein